ncbi:uncharacterized protein LOC129595089 isoform X2 [Paramacrobiotus metropolitanus]|uniref:uncharacterized protein LOC129595089 isoform X2 n=1 Tax=Paramacrobiotus metropolitanus TaxID=2943436 RepID=UPI0024464FD8|nr:uncharacterized protein LOC129595089 isoform X2 [Paramacrobiotus metropolitanus]
MFRQVACLIVGILCGAGHVDGALFQFNTSPMTLAECNARPINHCGPLSLASSDCRFLQKQSSSHHRIRLRQVEKLQTYHRVPDILTHVNLDCRPSDDMKLPTKQELKAQVSAIRKRSKDRAVLVNLWHIDLFAPDLLEPIGWQTVSPIVKNYTRLSDSNLTARILLLNLTNLLDVTFYDNGILNIKKSHFSGLHNIRAIAFNPRLAGFVEDGTFTDLPSLIFLGLESNPSAIDEGYEISPDLHCDVNNAWLWQWLAGRPSLQEQYDLVTSFL